MEIVTVLLLALALLAIWRAPDLCDDDRLSDRQIELIERRERGDT